MSGAAAEQTTPRKDVPLESQAHGTRFNIHERRTSNTANSSQPLAVPVVTEILDPINNLPTDLQVLLARECTHLLQVSLSENFFIAGAGLGALLRRYRRVL